jgi:Cu+-exporting ATPase
MNNIIKTAITFVLVVFLSCKGNQNSSDTGTSDSTTVVADTAASSTSVYTCPMHPEVVSDKPSQCPTCGMDLEPKS